MVTFVFTVYHLQDDGIAISDKITVDDILSDHSSITIHICDNFNIHQECLFHSNITDEDGKNSYDFAITYELTRIVIKPTRIPDIVWHYANLLDIFLTSCPN